MSAAILGAVEAMWRAQDEERARQAGERAPRHLVRLLDWAIASCEVANLTGARAAAPAAVAALVEQLQALEGGQAIRPRTALQALDSLFAIQERYLLGDPAGADEDDDEEEPEDAAAETPVATAEEPGDAEPRAPAAASIGELCQHLERVGHRVPATRLPERFRLLLEKRSPATTSVVLYERGGWRLRADWRARLVALDASGEAQHVAAGEGRAG